MKKTLLLSAFAAAAMCASATVITATPEGTLYDNVYTANDYTFLTRNGAAGYTKTEGGRTSIVVDETNSKIYLHNVVEFFPNYDAWIEGDLADDGTATFPMPQQIYVNPDNDNVYSVNMLVPEVNGRDVTLLPNADYPDLVMKWDGESLIQVMPEQTMPEGYERYLGYIGVLSSGTDAPFYGEAGLHYYVYPAPNALPDDVSGIDVTDYSMAYENEWGEASHSAVSICSNAEGEVWITGLNPVDPDQIVKGTKAENGDITLPSAQFTGYTQGTFTFFYGGTIYRENGTPKCEWGEEAVLKLVDGKYEAQDGMIFNVGNRTPQFGLGINNAVLTALDDINYVPATPEISGPEDDGTEVFPEDGMTLYMFCFYQDALSTDNTALDPANLYYTVYVNGEQVPVGGAEEMMEVPFGYNNDEDVFCTANFNMVIGFAMGEVETLGVQAVYKNKSGEETKSEMAVWVNPETGVANVSVDSEIVKVEYFDLTGRELTEPNGLVVRRTTYANGTVKTAKTVVVR